MVDQARHQHTYIQQHAFSRIFASRHLGEVEPTLTLLYWAESVLNTERIIPHQGLTEDAGFIPDTS